MTRNLKINEKITKENKDYKKLLLQEIINKKFKDKRLLVVEKERELSMDD